MGKGSQKLPSDQEETLKTSDDIEKNSKWETNIRMSDWGRSGSSRFFFPMCVVLVVLILILLVALTVVLSRSVSLHPDFSHVCPDGWLGFHGKCYYFSNAESNWTNSQENCTALGASLATITTVEELIFIKRYKGEANHWFGLRKEGEQWQWVNGTALNSWLEVSGGGPCAYLNQEKISSSMCHTKKNWLCSRLDNYVVWKQKTYQK